MHLMNLMFHALKDTTQLFFGNFSTTANISMSISKSVCGVHIFVGFMCAVLKGFKHCWQLAEILTQNTKVAYKIVCGLKNLGPNL
jgi:hypothetical protein